MQSIKVTILGKQYPLKVADEEVETMHQIARFVDEKFRLYKRELNKQPDTTIMVLAALSIAEELFEARKEMHEHQGDGDQMIHRINESLEELLDEIRQ